MLIPDDSEPITVEHKNGFVDMLGDTISSHQYKLMFALFIIFIFVNSDVFIGRVLGRVSGATEFNTTTNYGSMLQALFLVISYIIMETLIKNEVI